jgi:hypothetical protein
MNHPVMGSHHSEAIRGWCHSDSKWRETVKKKSFCVLVYVNVVSTSLVHKSLDDGNTKTFPLSLHVRIGWGLPPAMHFKFTEPPGRTLRSGVAEMMNGIRGCSGWRTLEDCTRGNARGGRGWPTSTLATPMATWPWWPSTMHWYIPLSIVDMSDKLSTCQKPALQCWCCV